MDDRLRHRALQRGYTTRAEIVACGYRDRDIKAALRHGLLVRLRHGSYAFADDLRGLDTAAHQRLMGWVVIDRLGPGFVLSHQSACRVHEIDTYGLRGDDVHVTRLDGRAGRHEAGVVHHVGGLTEEEVMIVEGRPVVRPLRAVFETTAAASTEAGVVIASSALHAGLVTPQELAATAARLQRWQGARHASLAFRLADGRCESPGESRSLFMMWRRDVPRPELQVVVVHADGTARVDFDWDAWCHTGEFDGLSKYGRLNPFSDDPGEVLTREKAREDAVRATGRGMTRWTWADLGESRAGDTASRLLADLDRSRTLYGKARVHIPLA